MSQLNSYRYSYFQHVIESDHEIEELPATNNRQLSPLVTITYQWEKTSFEPDSMMWGHHWRDTDDSITISFTKTKGEYYLYFPNLVCFIIDSTGYSISCVINPKIPLSTVNHLLIDQVLPRLFAHFHNYCNLHCSCVAIQEQGVCFLGNTGGGKSTIAAGFSAYGYSVVSDDCLHICMERNQLYGTTNYPGVRLLPDTSESLKLSKSDSRQEVAHYSDKQRIVLPLSNIDTIPVSTFFILGNPSEDLNHSPLKIKPVSKRDTVREFIKNSFCLDVSDNNYLRNQFGQVTEFAGSSLSVYEICYHRSYASLPDVIESVIRVIKQEQLIS